MKIKKINFGKWKNKPIGKNESRLYWTQIEPNKDDFLGYCLPDKKNIDSLITSLENVKVTKEESDEYIIKKVEKQGVDEVLNIYTKFGIEGYIESAKKNGNKKALEFWEEAIKYYPEEWGNGDSEVTCETYSDITVLDTGPFMTPPDTKYYYKTSEVIQVLKQWREYLIKTKEEEKKKEEKNKKPKSFFKKLFSKD